MVQIMYTVNVLLYEDETMVVTSNEIKGLFMEVNSYDELKKELIILCSRLLVSNHGLTEDDLSDVSILIITETKKHKRLVSKSDTHSPRLFIQENSDLLAMCA